MNLKLFSYCLLLASFASAANIESIVRKNQKAALPEFPKADPAAFSSLQKAAVNGDVVSQDKIPVLLTAHLKAVYAVLSKQSGLLFSVRKPARGYEKSASNYAVNIEEFFAETADNVRIKKSNFEASGKDGTVWQIPFLKYKPDGAMIEVKKNGQAQWLALADLRDADRRFVESAFADEAFESSGEFIISSADSRSDGETREKDKVSGTHYLTGEKLEGAYASASMNDLSRKIILENKSGFPMENLVVEHQSFVEQTIMKLPKDFPSDYRCVGFSVIKRLEPGEKKEIELTLPETVDAKQESINTGDYEYSLVLPPDVNKRSEGRINGIWVKVHRFTPYGQRLTREYQSAGVPTAEWANVAPTGADLRR